MKGSKIKHSKKQDGNEVSEQLKETTIAGLAQVMTRRHWLSKTIWCIIFIGSTVTAIWQTIDICGDYNKHLTSSQQFYKINNTIRMPAVTICMNNPVNWKNSTVRQILEKKLEKRLSATKASQKYWTAGYIKDLRFDDYILLDTIATLPENHIRAIQQANEYTVKGEFIWDAKQYLLLNLNQRKPDFKFYNESQAPLKKARIVNYINDFYLGECVTFNAETDVENSLHVAPYDGFTFNMRDADTTSDGDERYPRLRRKRAFVAIIHPVGTAPVFEEENVIEFERGTITTIGINQKEVTRLEYPYPSNCISNTNDYHRQLSVYYNPDHQYLYSLKACLKTCTQRMAMQFCNCWQPYIPVGFLKSEYPNSTEICPTRCLLNSTMLNTVDCGCHLPCWESVIESTVTTREYVEDSQKSTTTSRNGTNESINFVSSIAMLHVRIMSSAYYMEIELPKVTLNDFWGIVGGNLGLWLGVSVVTVFELLEVVITVFSVTFRKLCCCCKEKPGNVVHMHISHK